MERAWLNGAVFETDANIKNASCNYFFFFCVKREQSEVYRWDCWKKILGNDRWGG